MTNMTFMSIDIFSIYQIKNKIQSKKHLFIYTHQKMPAKNDIILIEVKIKKS